MVATARTHVRRYRRQGKPVRGHTRGYEPGDWKRAGGGLTVAGFSALGSVFEVVGSILRVLAAVGILLAATFLMHAEVKRRKRKAAQRRRRRRHWWYRAWDDRRRRPKRKKTGWEPRRLPKGEHPATSARSGTFERRPGGRWERVDRSSNRKRQKGKSQDGETPQPRGSRADEHGLHPGGWYDSTT